MTRQAIIEHALKEWNEASVTIPMEVMFGRVYDAAIKEIRDYAMAQKPEGGYVQQSNMSKEEAIERVVDEIDKVYTTAPLDFKKIGDIIRQAIDAVTVKLERNLERTQGAEQYWKEEAAKLREEKERWQDEYARAISGWENTKALCDKLREDFAAIDELYGKQLEESCKLQELLRTVYSSVGSTRMRKLIDAALTGTEEKK